MIRPGRLEDLAAIVAMRDALNALERAGCPHAPIQKLTLEQFTAFWGRTFEDADHCWRIVECARQPVGFGLVYLLPRSRPAAAFLHWAYLAPDKRRHGVGRQLVEDLITWARGRGACHVELQFIEGNEIARQFWTGVGFLPYARKCVYHLQETRQSGGAPLGNPPS
jgi:GNAT superfamily N-acetyltransferase